jgi:hypothetical protein
LENLKSYKSKTDVGHFPGTKVIELSVLTLERLLDIDDSFEFFKQLVDNKASYLDLEEDYRDLHEFFSNQLETWQQLQLALRRIEINKQALEKDDKAKQALAELQNIETAESPYGLLHKVTGLISTVETVIAKILSEKRNHAISRVDGKIKQLEGEIAKSGIATGELSNRLLHPLQQVKKELEKQTSIATIYMLQTQTATEHLDEGLAELELAIQEEAERLQRERELKEPDAKGGTGGPTPPTPLPKARPIVDVEVAGVFSSVSDGIYLESQADIDQFLDALKQELESAVTSNKRVRIR